MKKFVMFLIIIVFSYSFTLKATYKATYGWFGTIAEASGFFEKNETDYVIKTNSKLLGIAAVFSHHLKNSYISIGKIKNGILYPKDISICINL